MKKLYFGLLISLITSSLSAQLFTEVTGTPFADVYGPVAFADVDNDSDQDVLIGPNLYINDGNGSYEGGMWSPFIGLYVDAIAFADIDNDNDQDVLGTGFSGGWDPSPITKLYKNDGTGIYSGSTSPFNGFWYSAIAFADIDNDNDQDVLISGYTVKAIFPMAPKTALYLNDGGGLFEEVLGTPFDDVADGSIAFADVDNDDDQDVLITGGSESEIIAKLYTNDGNGFFTEVTETPFVSVSGSSSIAFADIDNDDDQDVLITGWSESNEKIAKLYTNDGNGFYAEVNGTPFEGATGPIAFADIDNDNDQDILIGSKLYTNDAKGFFTEVTGIPFAGVSSSAVTFADIDNDNDQDLLITGSNASNEVIAKLYRNNLITTLIPGENTVFNNVSVYPNPNQGHITLNLGELSGISIQVYGIGGQLVYQKENVVGSAHQFELDGEAGIYMLEISSPFEKQNFTLIKQ